MAVSHLFHIAIKTGDLPATQAFYERVLGFSAMPRPAFDFPGLWLKPPVPGADAVFHVYAGDAARDASGGYGRGTGVIDHVSVLAQGYDALWQCFERFGLPWRANVVPGLPLWQLFVYDPNGVMLELTFHADAEARETPVVDAAHQYRPREDFFDAAAYARLGAAAEVAA